VKDSHNTVQSVTQVNQLSNTVLLFALAVFVLSIAMAAYAIGVANQAERQAQNAEREARLAMDKEEIDASNIAVNKALIESYGIAKIVQQEKAK